jgi:ketosteroid isomerase-like protein
VSASLDLVRSIYDAWERGDFSATDWADPQIEYVVADGPSPEGRVGLDGMAEGSRDWFEAWEGLRFAADEYIELDDERVLVLDRYVGRGRTSGLDIAQTQSTVAHLFAVRGGKVARLVGYFDRGRALADLGLKA